MARRRLSGTVLVLLAVTSISTFLTGYHYVSLDQWHRTHHADRAPGLLRAHVGHVSRHNMIMETHNRGSGKETEIGKGKGKGKGKQDVRHPGLYTSAPSPSPSSTPIPIVPERPEDGDVRAVAPSPSTTFNTPVPKKRHPRYPQLPHDAEVDNEALYEAWLAMEAFFRTPQYECRDPVLLRDLHGGPQDRGRQHKWKYCDVGAIADREDIRAAHYDALVANGTLAPPKLNDHEHDDSHDDNHDDGDDTRDGSGPSHVNPCTAADPANAAAKNMRTPACIVVGVDYVDVTGGTPDLQLAHSLEDLGCIVHVFDLQFGSQRKLAPRIWGYPFGVDKRSHGRAWYWDLKGRHDVRTLDNVLDSLGLNGKRVLALTLDVRGHAWPVLLYLMRRPDVLGQIDQLLATLCFEARTGFNEHSAVDMDNWLAILQTLADLGLRHTWAEFSSEPQDRMTVMGVEGVTFPDCVHVNFVNTNGATCPAEDAARKGQYDHGVMAGNGFEVDAGSRGDAMDLRGHITPQKWRRWRREQLDVFHGDAEAHKHAARAKHAAMELEG